MSRKVCFVAVFAVFALLLVCLLLCLRITSMLELIFSQIPPHTYKVLRYGPLLCTKILHKKMRPFRAEWARTSTLYVCGADTKISLPVISIAKRNQAKPCINWESATREAFRCNGVFNNLYGGFIFEGS